MGTGAGEARESPQAQAKTHGSAEQTLAPIHVPQTQQEQHDPYGDSDFLRAVSNDDPAHAWNVMDELMQTLHVVEPRVYSRVMRKLGA